MEDELEAAKKALDKQKAILQEKNKELQKCEQERKKHEKEKVEHALKIKDLQHYIEKFHKDSRDAGHMVGAVTMWVCSVLGAVTRGECCHKVGAVIMWVWHVVGGATKWV